MHISPFNHRHLGHRSLHHQPRFIFSQWLSLITWYLLRKITVFDDLYLHIYKTLVEKISIAKIIKDKVGVKWSWSMPPVPVLLNVFLDSEVLDSHPALTNGIYVICAILAAVLLLFGIRIYLLRPCFTKGEYWTLSCKNIDPWKRQ